MAPSNVTFQFVAQPTESLVEEAAEVFSGVMGKDPVAICLTGGDLSLIPDLGLTLLRALVLTPSVSHMFIARDDTGVLVGFTAFALPGQLMLSTPEQVENANLNEFMSLLSPEGQAFYAETMKKLLPEANDEAFGIQEAERHTYWCNFAMVRLDYQGKGVAKRLFELAFQEADKLGASVALTTTNIRNVPIYKRIGFEYFGEKHMESPWTPWSLWFFKRAPLGFEPTPDVSAQ